MTSPAAQDAARIRRNLKAQGHNVKGVVRVRDNPGIYTEIEIDAHSQFIPYDDVDEACSGLQHWHCYSLSVL